MPSESLADIKQADWIRACTKLGLRVEKNRGKGSHALVKQPDGEARLTIQSDLHKIINQKYFKKLIQWGFTEERIFEALR